MALAYIAVLFFVGAVLGLLLTIHVDAPSDQGTDEGSALPANGDT
jgi:hypothetical protein